ncbi:MAG: type II toxin-antitoxin system VapC family toxin [Candidatus Dormibacteraceae bacterium]
MIVLDTTVLLYAKGAEHSLRGPCQKLVAAITEHEIEATTTVEVIQEFVHVRARRRGRAEAVSLGFDYAELLSPLLIINHDHLQRGLLLFERTPGLGAFDAILAEAAKFENAAALVSADAAFAGVPDLHHVTPDAFFSS